MLAADLFALLGRSPAEPEFDRWLTTQRIYTRPHQAQEDDAFDEDEDAAEQSAGASLIDEAEHLGICLIYDDRANQARLHGPMPGVGDFVLEQVALFAQGVQAYQGFRGDLPAGLEFGMTPQAARKQMGEPIASRTIHELRADLFLHQGLLLDLSYLEGAGLGIVHVRRLHRFDRQMLGLEVARPGPATLDTAALARLLGGSAYDPALEALLAPLGWSSRGSKLADADDVLDLVPEYGLTLYYRNAINFPDLKNRNFPRDHAVFAGFRLNRAGDMHSDGFQGELPMGLAFHQTPPQLLATIGLPPDWQSEGEDTGAYRWHLPHVTLQLTYSLLDWQLFRLTVFAKFMH